MIEFPAFTPHPLLRSGHAQTVFGSFLGGWLPKYSAAQHLVALEDGDAIVLHDDCPAAWKPGDRAVLLVHGLCGSHRSPYVARPAHKLQARGVRTFRMDLRSHGLGANHAVRIGHAGRSGDVAAAIARILELCPRSPLYLAGFSMGANIVLKLAGEWAGNAPPALAGVLAVAPPIDLHYCCDQLSRGWNFLYDRTFARNLGRHLKAWQKQNPQAPRLAKRYRRIFDFDDTVTAPYSGYRDAAHYYAEASCAPLLGQIQAPTRILMAEDDPIVPIACLDRAPRSPSTDVVITKHGGHLGYVSAKSDDPDPRWLDWRVVDWVLAERKPARRIVTDLFAEPVAAPALLAPAVCRSA